jgi:hypothetical protein
VGAGVDGVRRDSGEHTTEGVAAVASAEAQELARVVSAHAWRVAPRKQSNPEDVRAVQGMRSVLAHFAGGTTPDAKGTLSYGPPWAHYIGGYQDRLLGGPLGLPGLRYTSPKGVEHKDYIGVVLG